MPRRIELVVAVEEESRREAEMLLASLQRLLADADDRIMLVKGAVRGTFERA